MRGLNSLRVLGWLSLILTASCAHEPRAVLEPVTVQSSAKTIARFDPWHPVRVGTDYYPPESVRLREQGRCLVRITIAANGDTRDAFLVHSSGSPRLDEACMQALVPGHFLPATDNGRPVEVTQVIPIVWVLK